MKLYLARHGDYTLNTNGLDVLTERGVEDITRIAKWLKPLNLQVANIFHSGKNRAQQTAGLLAEGFSSDQPPASRTGLNPDDDVSGLLSELGDFGDNMLVVGHLPFLDKLVSQLLTGGEDKIIVNFQTGTLACLSQIDQVRWAIDWVVTPEVS
jgi:phosphohistidine phosphatase